MTHKWINEEISNFEYIMFLNTIAGLDDYIYFVDTRNLSDLINQ